MNDATKWDSRVLLWAGAGLVALAVAFLWNDLHVRPEALVAVGAVVAAGLTLARMPRGLPLLGPAALLSSASVGGLWYAGTRHPFLLVALAVTFLAALVAALRSRGVPGSHEDRLRRVVLWYGLAVAGLASSWAFYFQFFTLGIAQDEVARRMLLTLGWLGAGVAMVLVARRRGETVIRDAGFLLVAAAIGKALLYDTTHLSGALRVAVLAAAGVLMLAGGWMTSHPRASRS